MNIYHEKKREKNGRNKPLLGYSCPVAVLQLVSLTSNAVKEWEEYAMFLVKYSRPISVHKNPDISNKVKRFRVIFSFRVRVIVALNIRSAVCFWSYKTAFYARLYNIVKVKLE